MNTLTINVEDLDGNVERRQVVAVEPRVLDKIKEAFPRRCPLIHLGCDDGTITLGPVHAEAKIDCPHPWHAAIEEPWVQRWLEGS